MRNNQPQRAPRNRQSDLAAIHIAQKALGLSADDAVVLKRQVVGVESSAAMTDTQRRQYLAHLHKIQAQRDGGQRHTAPVAVDQDERWGKARALWHVLATAGIVQVDTDAGLMAYVKRQTRVDHWRFLNTYQMNAVVEALKKWAARMEVSENDSGT